jgi:hypothetical protein
MIDHFDGALTAFEADVREGKANVKVVSNHGKPSSGGGGSIDWLALLFLASVATGVVFADENCTIYRTATGDDNLAPPMGRDCLKEIE